MRRPPLYSASGRTVRRPTPDTAGIAPPADSAPAAVTVTVVGAAGSVGGDAPGTTPGPTVASRVAGRLSRHERRLWALGALLLAVVAGAPGWLARADKPMSLEQIDAAMRESIAQNPLPSAAADAYDAVLPAIVRIDGEPDGPVGSRKDPSGEKGHSVGTGVVIVDRGLILTALHVVEGAGRLRVTFFDGTEGDAFIVSRQPENDLAVLQARTLPDDLQPATLESSAGLAPGDAVLAVGFPFGIGPSVSSGIVSGLEREFRSPDHGRMIGHLIQFDAAVNPGNSGGPLVTMDGHVVGIVTAIMNPNAQRTFIGIGFAVPIDNAAEAVGLSPF
jgi:S1-C subfamily serine protease